ncbi:polyhydroxyalkanoic acid system family protein [Chitinimonas sp.]|uniref:polyhydroxyalkanoic acid system family protein n=1 Tax=Chitinimonas sp. TaxID=1934313 RepID=UPI002F94B44A
MAIHIQYPHSKPHDEARQLAQRVAEEMKKEFSMSYRWEGDVLHFQRSGVDGKLTVGSDEVVVDAKLGFLLSALQPKIEEEVRRFLRQQFG